MSAINISCDTLFVRNSSIFRWMICIISKWCLWQEWKCKIFAICPISLDSNYIDNFLIKKRIKMVSFYFVLIQCIFAMHIWRTNQIFLIFGTTKVFSQDCVNTLWVVQSKYCYILNTPENWTRLFIIIPSLCMTNLCL